MIEYISTDREGPPPHFHPWHEVEIVVEGEVEFYVNGQWTRGGPGTVQMLPAGASHSVRVPEGTARLLYVTIGAPYDGMAFDLRARAKQKAQTFTSLRGLLRSLQTA